MLRTVGRGDVAHTTFSLLDLSPSIKWDAEYLADEHIFGDLLGAAS